MRTKISKDQALSLVASDTRALEELTKFIDSAQVCVNRLHKQYLSTRVYSNYYEENGHISADISVHKQGLNKFTHVRTLRLELPYTKENDIYGTNQLECNGCKNCV